MFLYLNEWPHSTQTPIEGNEKIGGQLFPLPHISYNPHSAVCNLIF
jgi:hypothetical protein